jgi:pyrroloquinoline quinone biosynthesis protein D
MSTPDDRMPRLAPMFRLQFEPAQDAWVLLYPEGLVKLNGPASEILKRCDGKTRIVDLTTDLERAFSTTGLRDDVDDFLKHADEQHWIV